MVHYYTLITGASSGLGREIAVQLSAEKNIVIHGRDQMKLVETKRLCGKQHHVLVWPFDLNDIDHVEEALAQFIAQEQIAIDGFVHCAGVLKMIPLRSVTLRALQETYNVHVFAPELMIKVLGTRRNHKALKSAVLISSNIADRGAAAFSVYGSSKAAVDGIARNLAIELAPDVRVNSIQPGPMRTDMTEEMYREERGDMAKGKKLYGDGRPTHIVPMIQFLLSDQADWITGQNITIDGGITLDITER